MFYFILYNLVMYFATVNYKGLIAGMRNLYDGSSTAVTQGAPPHRLQVDFPCPLQHRISETHPIQAHTTSETGQCSPGWLLRTSQ